VANPRVEKIVKYWWDNTHTYQKVENFENKSTNQESKGQHEHKSEAAAHLSRRDTIRELPSNDTYPKEIKYSVFSHLPEFLPERSKISDHLWPTSLKRFYRIPKVKFLTESICFLSLLFIFSLMLNDSIPVDAVIQPLEWFLLM
jgi:hypothetical protein